MFNEDIKFGCINLQKSFPNGHELILYYSTAITVSYVCNDSPVFLDPSHEDVRSPHPAPGWEPEGDIPDGGSLEKNIGEWIVRKKFCCGPSYVENYEWLLE